MVNIYIQYDNFFEFIKVAEIFENFMSVYPTHFLSIVEVKKLVVSPKQIF